MSHVFAIVLCVTPAAEKVILKRGALTAAFRTARAHLPMDLVDGMVMDDDAEEEEEEDDSSADDDDYVPEHQEPVSVASEAIIFFEIVVSDEEMNARAVALERKVGWAGELVALVDFMEWALTQRPTATTLAIGRNGNTSRVMRAERVLVCTATQ